LLTAQALYDEWSSLVNIGRYCQFVRVCARARVTLNVNDRYLSAGIS